MSLKTFVELAEHYLGRIHLLVWVIEILSAVVSAAAGYMSGAPLPFVALAVLGVAVAVGVVLAICYAAWRWASRLIRRRSESHGISITLGSGPPFHTYKSGLHQRSHLIKVGVANPSSKRALTNCQLSLESITGMFASKCPIIIKANFILNPGAHEYIYFASLDESGSEVAYVQGEQKFGIRVYFHINPLPSDKSSWLDDQPYTLTLLATAAESPPRRLNCRLYVERGALKLEAA